MDADERRRAARGNGNVVRRQRGEQKSDEQRGVRGCGAGAAIASGGEYQGKAAAAAALYEIEGRKVLPFLKPEQHRTFYDNDVTLDYLALLYDNDLDDLLGSDDIAKSRFRALYPRPDDAGATSGPPPPQRPRAPPTLVSAVEVLHLEDEEPARVFLSIVSDVAGAAWTEDGWLGATLTKKGVSLALINLMRAGALKRRWVEYGRKPLDDGSILSTLEYVAWPKAVRAQLLAPQMYLRRTAEGVRALGR